MQEEEEAGKCIWVKDWLNFSNLLQIQMFILPFTKPKVPMNYSSNYYMLCSSLPSSQPAMILIQVWLMEVSLGTLQAFQPGA